MSSDINTKNDGRWKVSSVNNLWEPIMITVENNYIVACNVRQALEIGSNFESMKKYWESFEGENKYLIQQIKDGEY